MSYFSAFSLSLPVGILVHIIALSKWQQPVKITLVGPHANRRMP